MTVNSDKFYIKIGSLNFPYMPRQISRTNIPDAQTPTQPARTSSTISVSGPSTVNDLALSVFWNNEHCGFPPILYKPGFQQNLLGVFLVIWDNHSHNSLSRNCFYNFTHWDGVEKDTIWTFDRVQTYFYFVKYCLHSHDKPGQAEYLAVLMICKLERAWSHFSIVLIGPAGYFYTQFYM